MPKRGLPGFNGFKLYALCEVEWSKWDKLQRATFEHDQPKERHNVPQTIKYVGPIRAGAMRSLAVDIASTSSYSSLILATSSRRTCPSLIIFSPNYIKCQIFCGHMEAMARIQENNAILSVLVQRRSCSILARWLLLDWSSVRIVVIKLNDHKNHINRIWKTTKI